MTAVMMSFKWFLFFNIVVGGIIGGVLGWLIALQYKAFAGLDGGAIMGLIVSLIIGFMWLLFTVVWRKTAGRTWQTAISEGLSIMFPATVIVFTGYYVGSLFGAIMGLALSFSI